MPFLVFLLVVTCVLAYLVGLAAVHALYGGRTADWWTKRLHSYPELQPTAVPSVSSSTESPNHIYHEGTFPDGSYIELPLARTRYYLLGPVDGPKIVCVHGIAAPSTVFIHVAEFLARKGMRVLLYDLPGRGFSGASYAVHDEKLYVAHLSTLLRALEWNRFHLFGYSMGGAISTAYAEAFPDEIEKLILFAPAGLIEKAPWIAHVMAIPPLGELMMLTFAPGTMKHNTRKNFRSLDTPAAIQNVTAHNFQVETHPGYLVSFLSCVRHFPTTSMHSIFANVGKHPRETLILWGTADHVVPFESTSAALRKLMPHAKYVFFTNLNHNAMIEEPEDALRALSEFLGI